VRAALYLRVSTEEQTTANQRAELEAYVARRGWVLAGVYDDTGSGGGGARPGWRALMNDARRRRMDVVCVWALDRITRRGASALHSIFAELDALGVAAWSYSEPLIDTSGPFRDVLISFLGTLAKMERQKISERTKSGMARARRDGVPLGRPRLDSAKLASAANLVAHGFSYRAAAKARGVSPTALRRWVRQNGSTTPHAPDPRQLAIPE
jgi:DNA invertase Pin-like site-specific DNA recombinase